MSENITIEVLNGTFDPYQDYTLTYANILDKMSDGFIEQLFRISIAMVILNLYAFMYTRRFDTPTYVDLARGMEVSTDIKGLMLLKSCATISLVLSLFFPILIIGYKTGWYI